MIKLTGSESTITRLPLPEDDPKVRQPIPYFRALVKRENALSRTL